MVVSTPQKPELRLHYHAFDYLVVSGLLVIVSIVAGFLVFMPQPDMLRRIFVLCSAMTGLLAIWSLRFGLRLKRQAAWYVCFRPGLVLINFFNHSMAAKNLNQIDSILEIPNDQLIWIRTTKEIGFGDDSDQFYVDMCVTHSTWMAAKDLQTSYWPTSDPLAVRGPGRGVAFFDDDIMRIGLVATWPKDLVQHWHFWKYPVAADDEIKQVTAPKMAGFSPE